MPTIWNFPDVNRTFTPLPEKNNFLLDFNYKTIVTFGKFIYYN